MSLVTVEVHDQCAVVSLNRPDVRNALNNELIQALRHTLAQYQHHQTIRSIILCSNSEHFCAGADIKEMQHLMQASYQDNVLDAQLLAELLWEIYTFPIPVIALALGGSFGGGIGLLAASDIVIAANTAFFSFSEVKLGIVPAVISPYVLRAMGVRALQRYVLTGEQFNAATALQLGLVHEITTSDQLLAQGFALARLIAQNGPTAVKAAKVLLRTDKPLTKNAVLAMAEQLATIRQTVEAQEGFDAFIEKRLPSWRRE
jgi:methylglutaconyl-CoA hydratase